VEEGALTTVAVEGWEQEAYLSDDARLPRAIEGASLLSPFDPVVWFRPRAERLFDFHYRIEIYVPAGKRRWGYYVLPFRVGDRIVGRVDLKADRKAGQLLVLNAHEEDSVDIDHCCGELRTELHAMKDWLELDEVRVEETNQFSRRLRERIH
ncbi:MAG: DNA glycosylase AlkZ-like family protein, partial [Gammaproteobacteria bacterium]